MCIRDRLHPTGPKHNYAYHTEAMDRAMEGGIDDVGLGVLYGLELYRYEFAGLLMHAEHLEAVHGVGPHTISVPRIKRADDIDPSAFDNGISDEIFLKLCALDVYKRQTTYSSPGPLATRARPCARPFATTRTISAPPAAARCFAWMGGILRSTARTKMCLRRCTPTRNCGRCAIGSNTSPTRTTGGRRFASETIFPAPVLTDCALSAIIKHTVRQSHSCGAPEN